MSIEKKISIITVNYNGVKDTCELMESLPLNDESLEVIVVDNGSFQDEASEIEKRFPQVLVIRSDKNLGFAGGNNLGIQAAHGKYLFFINNDTIIHQPSTISHLMNRLDSSPSIGMVSPKIRFSWGSQQIQYAGYTPLSPITLRNKSIGYGEEDQGQYDAPHPTPYAHGAAMMVKREVIEQTGLMPECYFLYYEELDWSEMISRAGFEVWYEPACTVFHKESQTTGRMSPMKIYYITRNRLLFTQRNVKGGKKYLSYHYQIGIVAPKDILKYLCLGHFNLSKAVIKGIMDFIKL